MRRLLPITAALALVALLFGGSAEATVQVTAAFSPTDDSQSEFCVGFTDTLNLTSEDSTGTIGWLGEPEPLPFTIVGGALIAELVTPVEEDPGTVTREVFEIDLVFCLLLSPDSRLLGSWHGRAAVLQSVQ